MSKLDGGVVEALRLAGFPSKAAMDASGNLTHDPQYETWEQVWEKCRREEVAALSLLAPEVPE